MKCSSDFECGNGKNFVEVAAWRWQMNVRGDRPGYEPANPEMAVIYCRIDLDGKAPAPERKPASKIAETVPVQKVAAVPRFLTHNERMRRFRDTHPLPEADPDARLTA